MPAFALGLCLCLIATLAVGDASARTPSVTKASNPSRHEIVHVVQVGQYLNLIAKRYHTTAEAIRRTNRLAGGATLKPGTVLRIEETPAHQAWRDRNELRVKRTELPTKPSGHTKKGTNASPKGSDSAKKREPDGRRSGGSTDKSAPDRGASPRKPPSHSKEAKKNQDGRHEDRTGGSKAVGKGGSTKSSQGSAASKKGSAKDDPWAKKPKRAGYVVLSRFGSQFRGLLRASNGRVIAKAAEKVDWLLRSRRTQEQAKIDRRLLKLLTQVSDHFGGRTIELVSGFRPYSPSQYTKNSRHNHGEAIDFRIVGVPNLALYEYCLTLPQTGCGYYPNSSFIHMDVRLLKTRWIDYSRPGQAPIYKRKKPAQVAPKQTERESSGTQEEDDNDNDDPEPDDD